MMMMSSRVSERVVGRGHIPGRLFTRPGVLLGEDVLDVGDVKGDSDEGCGREGRVGGGDSRSKRGLLWEMRRSNKNGGWRCNDANDAKRRGVVVVLHGRAW